MPTNSKKIQFVRCAQHDRVITVRLDQFGAAEIADGRFIIVNFKTYRKHRPLPVLFRVTRNGQTAVTDCWPFAARPQVGRPIFLPVTSVELVKELAPLNGI